MTTSSTFPNSSDRRPVLKHLSPQQTYKSTVQGKSPALIGFDPLMDSSTTTGSGVWVGGGLEDLHQPGAEANNTADQQHPLMVSLSPRFVKTTHTDNAQPQTNSNVTVGGAPRSPPSVTRLVRPSSGNSLSPMRRLPSSTGKQQQQQQQQQQQPKVVKPTFQKAQSTGVLPPTHRKKKSQDGLLEIAKALAINKPISSTQQEDELITSWANSAAAPQTKFHKKYGHRKSKSTGAEPCSKNSSYDLSEDEGIVKEAPLSQSLDDEERPMMKKISSLRLSTPTRRKIATSKFAHNGSSIMSSTVMDSLAIPILVPLSGFLKPSDNLAMRSSEQEPSLHQMELPSCFEVLMHSRLCAVLNQYRIVDQNFDFGALVGASRLQLQGFISSNAGAATATSSKNQKNTLFDGLIQQHTPIMQSLLECSDDVILEGFFREDSANDANERTEAAVFNCQSRRQFVVVYRGTTSQQAKPVRTKQTRLEAENLHPDQPVGVFPIFRESYFHPDLEARVFALLDRLSEQYPFCDVVMTGHSFGGALATIAGLRFASCRETIRVSCHGFGCPKVGGKSFREMVNSVPNLKVIRVEHENDLYVQSPDTQSWMHVGHTVVVNPDRKQPAVAYRFEKNKKNARQFLGRSLNKKLVKSAHGIEAYEYAMEQFARLGLEWVKNYAGEDVGKGVKGGHNEKRLLV